MKKVFLIYAPSPKMNRTARCQQPVKELIVLPPLPPTDLMYCASVAEKKGATCIIKDYSVTNGTLEDLKKDLAQIKPDILLVNIADTTFETDIQAFSVAKSIDTNILTVATGAHFITESKPVLKKYEFTDVIIKGEPEIPFGEIVEGKDFSQIKGLTFRKNSEIIENENAPFLENLDELPLPARNLTDNDLYIRPDTGEKQAIIRVEAGCPNNCFFCLATKVSGAKARYRSAESIISEIKECKSKYEIKNFVFWSDLFTADKGKILELCEKISAENLDINWSANSRVDTIDEELLSAMKKSGCSLISLGIESGSQKILDKIGKRITKQQAENAVKLIKQKGLKVFAYFVIGLPWETENDIMETIDFAIKLDPDYVNFYTATALTGSRFFDYIKENNLGSPTDKDFYKNPYYYPCVPTHHVSKEKIKELHKLAVKKFYLRPSYIFKKLREIKNFTQLKNYFSAGMSIILKK